MLCQSIGWISTLMPAFSSWALATGAICLMTPRSVGCGMTMGVPSYLASASSSLAFATLPSSSPSMPAVEASGESQVNIALQVR